ncbi:uroporphyrinogen-III synthase [Guyparkeria hydrothermalis]|uniref:uroporphyrinogen-III synthase n=1 Tax=Guyparkeria hydrothermalis TaxID=923 RepID=UPI00201FF3F3|nr:uroporphyrinogen-III synthase [Guyparkeria hydrothermalis]
MTDHRLPPIREVVLTRPAGSNAGLQQALLETRPAGCPQPIVTIHPLLAIRPLPRGGDLPDALATMTSADLVVFVSPRAVEAARAVRPLTDWPAREFAAVGAATGRALADAGRPATFLPDSSEDSEGLLDCLREAPMSGRRVWIVRGETGRELLADTLAARGAESRFVAVYRRECLEPPAAAPAGPASLWIITAPQALDCLARLAAGTHGSESGLLDSSLLVINERARERARALGFRGPVALAGGPGVDTLARATWRLIADRADRQTATPPRH